MVERIREIAKSKNSTLAAIEKRLGFGNGTIRKWDDNSPSIDRLYQVAKLLDTSLDYLLNGTECTEKTGEAFGSQFSEEDRRAFACYAELSLDDRMFIKGEIIRRYEAHRPRSRCSDEFTNEIAT